MMEEQMSYFPLTKRYQADDLIRSFVTYMGDRVHKDRPINTFVLLIDEASAIEEHILQRYSNSEDVTSCARHALLIEDITYNGGAFHAALGISDSSVDPINETGSNRAIYDLVLPSRLDKTAIVTEILNKGNRSHLSPTHYHRLELIAATVNNSPRLVEIARDYISAKQTDVLIVDEEFVTGLYVHLDSEIESRYDGRRQFICPPDQLLRALVLGDDVKLDRENLKCITYSVITNSLDNFAVGQILVCPEISLPMMRYVSSRGKTALAKAISDGITAIMDVITLDESKGRIWGKAYSEWIKIRLAAMCKYVPDKKVNPDRNDMIMNIKKLFGINYGVIPHVHSKILYAPLGFSVFEDSNWTEHHLTNNSCKKTDLFLKEIDNITLSASCPVAIVFPVEQEAWDLCLKILIPGYDEPIHIFVENKTVEESQESADRVLFDVSDSKRIASEELEVGGSAGGGKQHTHTESVMKNRKIVNIYVRTHNTVRSRIDNAIQLGREDHFSFLGPLIDFY